MGICIKRSVSIARGRSTLCLFTHANEGRQSREDRLDSWEAALVDTEEDLLEAQGQSATRPRLMAGRATTHPAREPSGPAEAVSDHAVEPEEGENEATASCDGPR